MLLKQNEKYVEQVILDFLTNDTKYGHLIKKEEMISINNTYSNAIQTKMQAFLRKPNFDEITKSHDSTDNEKVANKTQYKMTQKHLIYNVC